MKDLSACVYFTIISEKGKVTQCPKCGNINGFYCVGVGREWLICNKCGENFKE